jgi:phosphoserine phosphatase
MSKRACITFDFDGTLYPIAPYDSEQRLIRKVASTKGTLFRQRAKRLILQDQKGTLIGDAFHKRYADLVRTANAGMIDEVARDISLFLSTEDIQALACLGDIADLAVLTCGTENLVESFLQQTGLKQHFFLIRGKRLVWDEAGKSRMVVDINGPQAKAQALEQLRRDYPTILAGGDGPTDIPMLKAADLGLVINWNQSQRAYLFETHTSLADVCSRLASYLASA